MNTCKKLIVIICLIFLALIVWFVCYQIGCLINKANIFFDSYNIQRSIPNLVNIDNGFLISVDPNNNWIRLQLDPNYVEFKIKGKLK